MSEKRILFGNKAIARGTYKTRVGVSAAHSSAPSTEVSESLVQYDEICTERAPNEKMAVEVAIGASIAGMRFVCVMKHAGINAAADLLYMAVYTGVRGGLVLVVADNPDMCSSQSEQNSRMVVRVAIVLIAELSDSTETKEFMKYACDLGEKYDTSIILRSTIRLSHSRGLVELEERAGPLDISYERDMAKYAAMPGSAIKCHMMAEAHMKQIAEGANSSPISRVECNDLSVGFITDGITYQYVKEVMPQVSVLKLGLLNSLPRKPIEEFASRVGKPYIFEELEPVVEEQVKFWDIKKTVGKEIFTVQGEYSANLIREHVLGQASQMGKMAQVPARSPILCPECPHRNVCIVLDKLEMHAAGDIGCYTSGTMAPLSAIDTTICMGASTNTLHGMEKAGGREYIRNWVTVIDNPIFMHTGINSLMNMVYNQATGTMVILNNPTTGMTGHQDHATIGKTLKGQVVPAINIHGLYKSLDTKHVREVNDFSQTELGRIIKEEAVGDAASVIIARASCALLKRIKSPSKCRSLPDRCRRCRACLRPGCSTLTENKDGTIFVDGTMCDDYGLCKRLCRFDAINLVKVGK